MLKQYLKMAIQMLKENPLVSTISILGTALSIAMIMLVVLIYQIDLADFSPENNRHRTLYIYGTAVESKDGTFANHGVMSLEVVKACFYPLQTAEAVTAIATDMRPLTLPGKRLFEEYAVKATDPGFWKLFDFRFIQGAPFTEADHQSGIAAMVISEKVAKAVFGTTDVVGKTVLMDAREFTIRGVVKEVSRQAMDSFSEIWIPYTTDPELLTSRYGFVGSFQVLILAKDKKDFPAIRTEVEKRKQALNESSADQTVDFPNGPTTRTVIAMGGGGFRKVTTKDFLVEKGVILLFLLLLPALNLTGVTQSTVQRRRSEVGVRKAFGATHGRLWMQIVCESCVTSCIGGVIGLALSFVLLDLCKSFLLQNGAFVTAGMLFQPATFAIALVFVLLLNLLSSTIPAIRTARQPIVDALKDND